MQRTVDVNYNLLRLQLGLQAGTPITLADQLDNFLEVGNFLKLAGQEFDINQNAPAFQADHVGSIPITRFLIL